MDERLDNFFTDAIKLNYYEGIKQRPAEFDNWQEDKHTARRYARWIQYDSNCASLKLDIDIPYKEILEEAKANYNLFVKHRGEGHGGWYSMTIHGQAVDITSPTDLDIPHHWTELSDRCPVVTDWLKNTFPFTEYKRVRFMLLKPGGFVLPHVDCDIRHLAAINIGLNNPEGVEFAQEDTGIIPWKDGDIRYIDTGRRHAVRNLSSEDRIHIIIHGKYDGDFKYLVCQSYDNLLEQTKI